MSRTFTWWAVLAVALCGAVLASPAAAGEPRAHDGFLLRLSAGAGAARSEIEVLGDRIELSGTPGDVNIAIGGMIAPNLALHGTLWGWSITDPDVEFAIAGVDTASGSINGDATMGAAGIGITYYFMPVNMYASGSVGFGTLTLDGDVNGETDAGVAIDVTVGKEWWVGNAWGLGLSGGFGYHSLPDKDVDENWSGTSFTLRFSATLN